MKVSMAVATAIGVTMKWSWPWLRTKVCLWNCHVRGRMKCQWPYKMSAAVWDSSGRMRSFNEATAVWNGRSHGCAHRNENGRGHYCGHICIYQYGHEYFHTRIATRNHITSIKFYRESINYQIFVNEKKIDLCIFYAG